jgi:hypothetical protein
MIHSLQATRLTHLSAKIQWNSYKLIRCVRMMEMSVTSPENWEKFVETGDNSFLGDIDIGSAPKGTEAVLSAEGLERRIILAEL